MRKICCLGSSINRQSKHNLRQEKGKLQKGKEEHRGASTKTLVDEKEQSLEADQVRVGALQNYGHRKAIAQRCERLRKKSRLYLPKEPARLKWLKIDFLLTNKNEKRIASCSARRVTHIASA